MANHKNVFVFPITTSQPSESNLPASGQPSLRPRWHPQRASSGAPARTHAPSLVQMVDDESHLWRWELHAYPKHRTCGSRNREKVTVTNMYKYSPEGKTRSLISTIKFMYGIFTYMHCYMWQITVWHMGTCPYSRQIKMYRRYLPKRS